MNLCIPRATLRNRTYVRMTPVNRTLVLPPRTPVRRTPVRQTPVRLTPVDRTRVHERQFERHPSTEHMFVHDLFTNYSQNVH